MPIFRLFEEYLILDPAISAPAGWTVGNLAAAINAARINGRPLLIRPGVYDASNIDILPSNGNGNSLKIIGSQGACVIRFTGGNYCIQIKDVNNIEIYGLTFTGQNLATPPYSAPNATTEPAAGLIITNNVKQFRFVNCTFADFRKVNNEQLPSYKAQLLATNDSKGTINGCYFGNGDVAIWSFRSQIFVDANRIENFQSNGIAVYDISAGGNSSIIKNNFINNIDSLYGNGQTGNCIVAYRANYVNISDNTCVSPKYSGIRCNSASKAIVSRNSIYGARECAIFAEAPGAGLDMIGSIVTENIIEACGDGIKVSNSGYYNDGISRMSIVKGNVITDLRRNSIPAIPSAPSSITTAEGIGVEQDCVVEGNIVEGAFIGAKLGVAQGARDLNCDGNIIRNCQTGIAFSSNGAASNICITNNLIRNAPNGAIISTPSLGSSPVTATYNANSLTPQTAGTGGTVLIEGNRSA